MLIVKMCMRDNGCGVVWGGVGELVVVDEMMWLILLGKQAYVC